MKGKQSRFVTFTTLTLIAFAIIFGVYLGFKNRSNYTSEEWTLFIALMTSYCVTVGLMIMAKVRHALYLFEPFTIVGVLYIAIFVYRPIIDLFNSEVATRGVNVLSGGFKTTIIFTVGFIALYVGYYSKHLINVDQTEEEIDVYEGKAANTDIALIGWIVSYVFCLISLVSQGLSLSYIFSLASSGEKVFDGNGSALLFLSNFAITMVAYWMIIVVRPGKKNLKLIITILSIVYVIMRNARWLLLIGVLAPITYYYVRRRKSPKGIYIIIVGVLTLSVFAWMQVNRASLIAGRQMVGWGEGGFIIEKLLSPFDSDLTTYKVIYGMVREYPSHSSYLFGRSFLYVFYMFIPRVLWPSKPGNPINEIVENSLNFQARTAGATFANIGEFYANFGVLGVIILMFIFGRLIASLKKYYLQPTQERLIIYSIMYPLLFQWVARGNFTGNFYLTIFAILPFVLGRITIRSK